MDANSAWRRWRPSLVSGAEEEVNVLASQGQVEPCRHRWARVRQMGWTGWQTCRRQRRQTSPKLSIQSARSLVLMKIQKDVQTRQFHRRQTEKIAVRSMYWHVPSNVSMLPFLFCTYSRFLEVTWNQVHSRVPFSLRRTRERNREAIETFYFFQL